MGALNAAQIVGDFSFPVPRRPARRGSGEAAHTRKEWCNRLSSSNTQFRPAAGTRAMRAVAGHDARLHSATGLNSNCFVAGMHLAPHPLVSPGQARRMARTSRRRGFPTAPILRWWPVTPYQSSRRRETGFSGWWPHQAARRFASGVASNVARRSRTICQGGSSLRMPAALQIPPDRLRELLARQLQQPVGIADGNPTGAVETRTATPRGHRQPRESQADPSRIEAEMRMTDGAEFGRGFPGPAAARRRRRGGHRQHHGVIRPVATVSSPNLNSPILFADIPNSRSSCPN